MVMSFFRKGDGGLDTIAAHTVSMLAEARHSFDLSSMALLSGGNQQKVLAARWLLKRDLRVLLVDDCAVVRDSLAR